jgi:hypothetical protein
MDHKVMDWLAGPSQASWYHGRHVWFVLLNNVYFLFQLLLSLLFELVVQWNGDIDCSRYEFQTSCLTLRCVFIKLWYLVRWEKTLVTMYTSYSNESCLRFIKIWTY